MLKKDKLVLSSILFAIFWLFYTAQGNSLAPQEAESH